MAYRAGFDAAWVPPNCGVVLPGLEENHFRTRWLRRMNLADSVRFRHSPKSKMYRAQASNMLQVVCVAECQQDIPLP